jgi:hypothetical protein
MTASESKQTMNDAHGTQPLFHGKFIPNDPHPLPLFGRIAIGIGVGLVIFVFAALCLNVLNSWGVWVTLLIVSLLTATSLVVWLCDALSHPATETDATEIGETQ